MAVGHWLPGGISLYFDQPLTFGWLSFFAMVVVMVAPYVMAFAAASAALARRYQLAWPLLVAAAWVAAEWGRGSLFTATGRFVGNPWALLGYSQGGHETLAQLASLTGVYGISFVLVVVSATLAGLIAAATARQLTVRRAAAALALAALPVAAALGYGRAVLPSAPDPALAAQGTTVAVVQGHIGLAERWHRHFHGRNLTTYLKLSDGVLARSGAEILVWPEAAMTFLLDDQPEYRRSIASFLRARGAELVSGIPHRDGPRHEAEPPIYNSVVLLSEDAEVRARYDKVYLLPFAEYVPFGDLPGMSTLFGRFRPYARGNGAELLPTRAGPAGILVCNEAVLPEVARRRVREGAVLLVNPSNDSWSRHPKFTGQWFDIVRFRAIEQRRYLIRASTSGPSAVIDPWGRVLAQTERFARGAAAGPVAPRRALSIYGRVGDLFALLCTLAVLVALVVRPAGGHAGASAAHGRAAQR